MFWIFGIVSLQCKAFPVRKSAGRPPDPESDLVKTFRSKSCWTVSLWTASCILLCVYCYPFVACNGLFSFLISNRKIWEENCERQCTRGKLTSQHKVAPLSDDRQNILFPVLYLLNFFLKVWWHEATLYWFFFIGNSPLEQKILVSNTCVASIPNYMRAMKIHCPKRTKILPMKFEPFIGL